MVDCVLIDATPDTVRFTAKFDDKKALVAFINASINDLRKYVVNISNYGTDLETLQTIRKIIFNQRKDDGFILMPRDLFDQMGIVAGAWIRNGFEHVEPDSDFVFEADKATVYAVRAMFEECQKMELPQ